MPKTAQIVPLNPSTKHTPAEQIVESLLINLGDIERQLDHYLNSEKP